MDGGRLFTEIPDLWDHISLFDEAERLIVARNQRFHEKRKLEPKIRLYKTSVST
jgi:hypothetical protein